MEGSRRRGSPFDESKLQLLREFLRREFRDCYCVDFVAVDDSAQIFLIDTWDGVRHMLIVPEATFAEADMGLLCNANLSETLRDARESRVTLTSQGAVVGA
jgi:hypothetical protein